MIAGLRRGDVVLLTSSVSVQTFVLRALPLMDWRNYARVVNGIRYLADRKGATARHPRSDSPPPEWSASLLIASEARARQLARSHGIALSGLLRLIRQRTELRQSAVPDGFTRTRSQSTQQALRWLSSNVATTSRKSMCSARHTLLTESQQTVRTTSLSCRIACAPSSDCDPTQLS